MPTAKKTTTKKAPSRTTAKKPAAAKRAPAKKPVAAKTVKETTVVKSATVAPISSVNKAPSGTIAVKKNSPAMQKVVAELLGTFILTFSALVSGQQGLIFVPATLLMLVYLFGSISGAHFNPAVSIGMLSIRKITGGMAVQYIIAQILGALAAMALLTSLTDLQVAYAWSNLTTFSATEGLGELLGTFLLVFGITSVAIGRNREAVSGVVIGGSLFLGIFIALNLGAPGILNPAIGIGSAGISLMYFVGQIAGGVLGAFGYSWLAEKN